MRKRKKKSSFGYTIVRHCSFRWDIYNIFSPRLSDKSTHSGWMLWFRQIHTLQGFWCAFVDIMNTIMRLEYFSKMNGNIYKYHISVYKDNNGCGWGSRAHALVQQAVGTSTELKTTYCELQYCCCGNKTLSREAELQALKKTQRKGNKS